MRPLLVRPGARYTCTGDGACCSDLHVIAPLARSEVRRLRLLGAQVVRNEALDAFAMAAEGGACRELGAEGCRRYADRPTVCRRFPFRLVETPSGLRVATEQRCPCRTMGERPLIDPEIARAALLEHGRLIPDLRVGARIRLEGARWIGFSRYEREEAAWLARLAAGESPEVVLGVEPPTLDALTWRDVAHHFRGRIDGSACGEALAWFGDALLALSGDAPRRSRSRPWAFAFDRAEARSAVGDPDAMLADWLADALWDLEWTARGGRVRAFADFAQRLAVARWIAARLVA
ncbi:MAG: YkgJ family cysteine cluster protein, partial [Myxococcales bacterium]|nr:YkgJ family cysteine cluster protein [Myxococcales bacterium]